MCLTHSNVRKIGARWGPRSLTVALGKPRNLILVIFEILLAARRPAQRHLHGRLGAPVLRRMFGALVERHDDVGAESDLGSDGALRTEEMRRAVKVRAKGHAVFRDLAQIAEAENLKAAGFGEDGMVPRHELLYPAEAADHLDTGSQIKMVSVVQQDLDAEFFQCVLGYALHRGQCSHRHKDWSLHFTVRSEEAPSAGGAIAGFDLEAEGHCRRL